jgi:hypothetical protein
VLRGISAHQGVERAFAHARRQLNFAAGLTRPALNQIGRRRERRRQRRDDADTSAGLHGAVGHRLVNADDRHADQRRRGVDRWADRRARHQDDVGARLLGRS